VIPWWGATRQGKNAGSAKINGIKRRWSGWSAGSARKTSGKHFRHIWPLGWRHTGHVLQDPTRQPPPCPKSRGAPPCHWRPAWWSTTTNPTNPTSRSQPKAESSSKEVAITSDSWELITELAMLAGSLGWLPADAAPLGTSGECGRFVLLIDNFLERRFQPPEPAVRDGDKPPT